MQFFIKFIYLIFIAIHNHMRMKNDIFLMLQEKTHLTNIFARNKYVFVNYPLLLCQIEFLFSIST